MEMMEMFSLHGKTAVVTGSARGLGAEIALEWNQGVTHWRISPGGSTLEELCCRALCKLFELPAEADATLSYSGAFGNQQALYMALHHHAAREGFDYAREGLGGFRDPSRLAVLASEDAHSSLIHGVRFLGLGEGALIRVGVDENNRPQINFTLNPTATDRFSRETGRNIGRQLAIVLDGSVYSAPVIQSKLGADNRITGQFTTDEADELAKILRAGALPATLRYLQELTVGASLGRDSIRDGVRAAMAAMAFITLFMLVYYRLAGVNAVVALTANLLIVLAALAYFGATLTLPGIAGMILTVGVGVDTNVLVFERIREELRNGKTVRMAVRNGFEREDPAEPGAVSGIRERAARYNPEAAICTSDLEIEVDEVKDALSILAKLES